MRKLLLPLFLFAATLLNAQLDPLQQFFNKSFIPDLVEYDSIVLSLDSGFNFSPVATASQHYFTNGNIDTLAITQFGTPAYSYDGTLTGRTTTIVGTDLSTSTTVDKMVFKQDSLYRDSTIEYYEYTGSSFQLFFEAVVNYSTPTGNEVDFLDIYADLGSGPTKIGSYNYFYKGVILDSIYYTVSMSSNNDGYFKYVYDPIIPARQLALETYEDVDNDGEKDLIQRLIFDHDSINRVVQIREFNLNANNNLSFDAEIRYSTRKNSTLTLHNIGEISLSIYPNPAYNYLRIDLDKNVFTDFTVYKLSGQQLMKGKLKNEIDIENLARGTYLLKLSGPGGNYSGTFEKL